MSNASGSLVSITIAGRNFTVAADADTQLYLGGFINRVERNGDGTSRIVQERSGWSLTGAVLAIDHDRDDLQFLTAAKADPGALNFLIGGGDVPRISRAVSGGTEISTLRLFYPIEIELVDGTYYTGKGIPVGKIEASTMNGTAVVNLEGDEELKRN